MSDLLTWKVSYRLTDIDNRTRIESVKAIDKIDAEAMIEVMEAGHTVEFIDLHQVDPETGLRVKDTSELPPINKDCVNFGQHCRAATPPPEAYDDVAEEFLDACFGDCSCPHDRKILADVLRGERTKAVANANSSWEDKADEWSEQIKAAFPTRSGSHEQYAMAMKMVGNRHSKSALVALVNWLLVESK